MVRARRGPCTARAPHAARGPWVRALLDEVTDAGLPASSAWTLNAPGVFVQGARAPWGDDRAGQVR